MLKAVPSLISGETLFTTAAWPLNFSFMYRILSLTVASSECKAE